MDLSITDPFERHAKILCINLYVVVHDFLHKYLMHELNLYINMHEFVHSVQNYVMESLCIIMYV